MDIWYKDPSILFSPQNLLDFWPSPNASIEARINSTTRFIAYASTLLFCSTRKSKFAVYGMFLIGMLAFVYSKTVETEMGLADSTAELLDGDSDAQHFSAAAATESLSPASLRNASSTEHFSGQVRGPPQQLHKRDYVKFAQFLSSKLE